MQKNQEIQHFAVGGTIDSHWDPTRDTAVPNAVTAWRTAIKNDIIPMGYDIEQYVLELVQRPVELRFREVESIIAHYGYRLVNSKGSHFRFKKPNQPSITIVAHNKKVKKWYIKDMCKILLLQTL